MSVKPLVRWAMVQGYTLRYTRRGDESVSGVLITPQGELNFVYDKGERRIDLPSRQVRLSEYGWEVNPEGKTVFTSRKDDLHRP
jgi:hypothetical protein